MLAHPQMGTSAPRFAVEGMDVESSIIRKIERYQAMTIAVVFLYFSIFGRGYTVIHANNQ